MREPARIGTDRGAEAPGARRRRLPSIRGWLSRADGTDVFALVLLTMGSATFLSGLSLEPSLTIRDVVLIHYGDWAPGLLTDGLLLLVLNTILKLHERKRILSQVGSLSREFARDAVRRARSEGWLEDGVMRGQTLSRASLAGVDLSDAALPGADLSFAELRSAVLTHADLSGANLTGANLTDADLRWANLEGADLSWADLRGAILDGTRLEGVVARSTSVDPRHATHPALRHAISGGFLDDDEIGEVRRTFDLLADGGIAPIESFYRRLFAYAPDARPLFRSEPAAQARKFLQSLKLIVSSLHAPQEHVAILQRLGERHRGYGVHDGHYEIVLQSLLEVMRDALGPDFTPVSEMAWRRAFQLVAAIMTATPTDPREPSTAPSAGSPPLELQPTGMI